mgnify:CR=1 FL=1
MAEYIYQMIKARKAHGDKVILDDVTMAFLPGAKIGMVGPNGAGKSSILKIMAGIDQPSNGEARLTPGYSVGILLQEPPLNEDKTVLGNVEEGVAEIKSKLDRYNEISAAMADPDADFDALMAEMGTLQDALDFIAERPHPLAAYLFTDRPSYHRAFDDQVQAGGLGYDVGLLHAGIATLPFGGVGASGMGAYHGLHGFETFSHLRPSITKSDQVDTLKTAYPPYGRMKRALLPKML